MGLKAPQRATFLAQSQGRRWKTYLWVESSFRHHEKVILFYAMLCYAKSLQSCPTLCDPIDSSLPGSPVPGILQARILEWVAISFSNAWKWKVKVKSLSRVRLLVTPWTAAYQAPPSMGFSSKSFGVGCHRLLRRIVDGTSNDFCLFPNLVVQLTWRVTRSPCGHTSRNSAGS